VGGFHIYWSIKIGLEEGISCHRDIHPLLRHERETFGESCCQLVALLLTYIWPHLVATTLLPVCWCTNTSSTLLTTRLS